MVSRQLIYTATRF